jgi:hypothetical protein
LTPEQVAAKVAVDEILEREPSLAAARQRPDPALVRAAITAHNARDARLAALKAKEETDAIKRKEAALQHQARLEANAAALKAKQDAQAAKLAAKKPGALKPKPNDKVAAVPAAAAPQQTVQQPVQQPAQPVPPVQPVARMPEPTLVFANPGS